MWIDQVLCKVQLPKITVMWKCLNWVALTYSNKHLIIQFCVKRIFVNHCKSTSI